MGERVDFSTWPPGQREVVARMVHATADESFAASARIGSRSRCRLRCDALRRRRADHRRRGDGRRRHRGRLATHVPARRGARPRRPVRPVQRGGHGARREAPSRRRGVGRRQCADRARRSARAARARRDRAGRRGRPAGRLRRRRRRQGRAVGRSARDRSRSPTPASAAEAPSPPRVLNALPPPLRRRRHADRRRCTDGLLLVAHGSSVPAGVDEAHALGAAVASGLSGSARRPRLPRAGRSAGRDRCSTAWWTAAASASPCSR